MREMEDGINKDGQTESEDGRNNEGKAEREEKEGWKKH
jgi:hypothetical protein